jgi:hypothetical protein
MHEKLAAALIGVAISLSPISFATALEQIAGCRAKEANCERKCKDEYGPTNCRREKGCGARRYSCEMTGVWTDKNGVSIRVAPDPRR